MWNHLRDISPTLRIYLVYFYDEGAARRSPQASAVCSTKASGVAFAVAFQANSSPLVKRLAYSIAGDPPVGDGQPPRSILIEPFDIFEPALGVHYTLLDYVRVDAQVVDVWVYWVH